MCSFSLFILNQIENVCSLPPLYSDFQDIVVENGELSQTAETLLGRSGLPNNIKQTEII